MQNRPKQARPNGAKNDAAFVAKIICIAVATALGVALFAMLLYSVIAMANAPFCPTVGENKLIAVMDESMSPEIKKHSAIEIDPDEQVAVGSIIAYRENKVIIVRRVRAISQTDDGFTYDVVADAGGNKTTVAASDVVGVYTGTEHDGLGLFMSGIGSPQGFVLTLIIIVVCAAVIAALATLSDRQNRKELENAAIARSICELSKINLRYDNICEVTAVLDILDMFASRPKTRAQRREYDTRLKSFIEASTIELPQTQEAAAVLDSLPAPDTPYSLAAALRAGATLRQAEDGQTLVLTSLSGDKSILLTPIQTPDGIMLCRQGARVRTDIAPNIENIGATSMPSFPEFFEGQPLEKHVEYPELPEPHEPFGPDHLSGLARDAALTAPQNIGVPRLARNSASATAQQPEIHEITSHESLDKYIALAAPHKRHLKAEFDTLIASAMPLTQEEREMIAAHRAKETERKKSDAAKPKKELTPEQREARKAAAEKRKKAQQDFVNSLSPEDRAKYEEEQHLMKIRAAAVRKLKKAEADRKLLDEIKRSQHK